MTDFRAFSGEQSLDFMPRHSKSHNKPIILLGGLNGSGKTTTLMAIRAVIHGRQSLGQGTPTAHYHDFLKSCIHRNAKASLKCHQSSISLSFENTHMGENSEYLVRRSWKVDSFGNISESLKISKNDKILNELNYEQCQSFLNEIIPPGVADLFLFDGEKIADLAEDKNGTALSGALKKLVGIDLLETLQLDLKATQRRVLKRSSNETVLLEINDLEKRLLQTERQMQSARINIAEFNANLNRVENLKDRKNNEIMSRGGAWAEERDNEIKKEIELRASLEAQNISLKELLSSTLPFSHAPNYCAKVLKTLECEVKTQQQAQFEKTFKNQNSKLKKAMIENFDAKQYEIIERVLHDTYLNDEESPTLLHNISPKNLSQFSSVLESSKKIKKKAHKISSNILKLISNLEMTERNISRTPDEELLSKLKTDFDDLLSNEVELRTNLEIEKRSLKAFTLDAINNALSLKKITNTKNSTDADMKMIELCKESIDVVSDFADVVTKRKLKQLESEFYNSYQLLARKKDFIPRALIDPKTFNVSLMGSDSNIFDKNDLSAGEKQIYAIAMLDALGKVTGKNLPIIIDTPLGRLDSKHRDNIVENYFPFASHQIIILSTDTEIHKSYQTILSDSISHTIKLEYSEATNSTTVSNGYFWDKNEAKVTIWLSQTEFVYQKLSV